MAQYQITETFELLHHLFEKNTQDLRDGTALRIDLKPNPPSSRLLKQVNAKILRTNRYSKRISEWDLSSYSFHPSGKSNFKGPPPSQW